MTQYSCTNIPPVEESGRHLFYFWLWKHISKTVTSQWSCSALCCSATAAAGTPVLPSESPHSWSGHSCHMYSHILAS